MVNEANSDRLAVQVGLKHIALIMDGNGRWANQQNLPRTAGHAAGEKVLLDIVAACIEFGVSHLTVFAFSTENWRRTKAEVAFLMGFNRQVLRARRDLLNSWGVRIRWAGRHPRLWRTVVADLQAAEQLTKANSKLTLTMCVNYGGKAELLDAVNELSEQQAAGKVQPGKITEAMLRRALSTNWLPEVDLLIRTSGEHRLSNFLIWQTVYSELYFTDTLWPDFTKQHLANAIHEYSQRARRFGAAEDATQHQAE